MIGGNDEEELPGLAGRKVAAGDSVGSGETEPGPEKLNGGPEVGSHRKQESEPGMYRAEPSLHFRAGVLLLVPENISSLTGKLFFMTSKGDFTPTGYVRCRPLHFFK